MLARCKRIQQQFGTEVLLRVLFLLAGLVAMAIGGWHFLSSLIPTAIAAIGLFAGFALREYVVRNAESVPQLVKACLYNYALILLAAKLLDLGYLTQLSVITATTVLVFNLQFWSRSDPRVISLPDDDLQDGGNGTDRK